MLAGIRRSFSELRGNYGFFRAFLLIFIFPNAHRVISQIQASLKRSRDSDVMSFEQSLAYEFTMLAVAVAIVAQISISALSLDDLVSTHWTAKVAFVVSLITAVSSVFYACLL